MKTYWFIEPLDDFTNISLARFLVNHYMIDLNDLEINGKSVLTYRVDHSVITKLKHSNSSFKYNVYKRRGENGKLTLFSFDNLKKKNKKEKIF
ncbi:hypothetical protein EOL94_01970 [bacterium]|nr:hypothetical protein [bacterium]